MSRLWADRLLVSFSPSAVALVRVRRRWTARVLWKKGFPGGKPVESLRSAITSFGKERMRATVVLSNHYVRYAVVPFDAAVSSAEEELAMARYHFSRLHGERAKGWDLRLSDGPPGSARLASAVDADLVGAICGCFPAASGVKLVSLQPYLMAAYNRWRDAIAREDAWLMLPESDGACLAYTTRAGWLSARTFKSENDVLAENLEREQLRLAAAPRAVVVPGVPPPAPAGWKLSRLTLPPLDGYSPLDDSSYGMALCAR